MIHKEGEDLNTETLKIIRLDEELAKEICSWKYEGLYSVYNFCTWEEAVKKGYGFSKKEVRDRDFFGFEYKNEFIAYGRLMESDDNIFLGIGLKPEWCGKGHGKHILTEIIKLHGIKYPLKPLQLEVRVLNYRAIQLYIKMGFIIIDRYERQTSFDDAEFYLMEYNPNLL